MGQFDDPFYWQKKKMLREGGGAILTSKIFWIVVGAGGVFLLALQILSMFFR